MIREMKNTDPKVSVVVITYNHEKYIRECLNSIVTQQTDFPFEVLVHDDCSTDNTQEILKEYETKYPDIVRVLYEEENQYSKGNHTIFALMFPYARGEYIALCEGDDYYNDRQKLQIQYDTMKKYSDCHMCVHRVATIWENGENSGISVPKSYHENQIIDSRDFISRIQYYEFQTSCYFFRTEDALKFINPLPKYVDCADVGDECYKLFFGNMGDVCYIEKTMTNHRAGSIGGWNSRTNGSKRVAHYRKMIDMMIEYNRYTNYKYDDICKKYILHQQYQIAVLSDDYKTLISKEFRQYFKQFGIKKKVKILLKAFFR